MSQIQMNMKYILLWAKAYEEGDQIVEDCKYDSAIELLSELEAQHPQEYQESVKIYPEFQSGAWKHTGMFYREVRYED